MTKRLPHSTGRGAPLRMLLATAAILSPTACFAVDVMSIGGGQYEIVQELGFSYTQDVRQADAARYCKKRGRQLQVIADGNSLRFACTRRG